MSLSLNEAIINRLTGVESLTGSALTFYNAFKALFTSNTPIVRKAGKWSTVPAREITFRRDTGPLALDGDDSGIVERVIFRFAIWENASPGDAGRQGSFIPTAATYLEKLLDVRLSCPAWTLDSGKCYASYVFNSLQEPFHDDDRNAFFGMLDFEFIEARV